MSAHITVALQAPDGLFFKDGRGWFTSESGRGHSLDWPWPTTLLGALRAAYGRHLEAQRNAPLSKDAWLDETRRVSLGTTLPLRRPPGEGWSPRHRMWPMPVDALAQEGDKLLYRLLPARSRCRTVGRKSEDETAREALWRPRMPDAQAAKPEPLPAFLTEGDFIDWLIGSGVRKPSADENEGLRLGHRMDVRLSIDVATQAAQDGMLFATDVLEMLMRTKGGTYLEWAIALSGTLPTAVDLTGDPWIVGGKQHLAHAEALGGELLEAPSVWKNAFSKGASGLRLVVVTPTCFSRGWLPDGFVAHGGEYVGTLPGVEGEVLLRAALLPRPLHVSGWDMVSGGARITLRLVPTGAVYFVQKRTSAFSQEEVSRLFLAALGQKTEMGLGRVVPGLWTPEEQG